MAISKSEKEEFDIGMSRWNIVHDLEDVRGRLTAMRSVISWGEFLFDCEDQDDVDVSGMNDLVNVIDDLLEKQIAKMDELIGNIEIIFGVLIDKK